MAHVICPTCGKKFAPHETTAMPFCSERCRLVDLNRWLGERYCLPVARESDGESEQPDEEAGGTSMA
ncbi:MAG: DNA gyrase inhibitor YacG [Planctomycetes bacterium]|nr:DNA gyrase inhibitor YacG [Planctomycetota bacterium]